MVSLANIVVGVFDEYVNAEAARDELLEAGLSERHVRINDRQPPQRAESADEHDPFWRSIRDYFGIDDADDDAEQEQQPVGGAILTIVAQSASLDMIAEILSKYEPENIDQQQQVFDPGEIGEREI